MSEPTSRTNIAVFLLVVGGGLFISGQVFWTRYVNHQGKTAGSGVSQDDDSRMEKVGDAVDAAGGESGKDGEVNGALGKHTSEKEGLAAAKGEKGRRDGVGEGEGEGSVISKKPRVPAGGVITLIMGNKSARISSDHRRRLGRLVKGRTGSRWRFEVTAYAGERSTREKNKKLAWHRARNVIRVLRKLGVPKEAISLKRQVAGKSSRFRTVWRKVEVEAKRGEVTK